MSTVTITLAGSGIVNGTKSYTINDTDLQLVLNWSQSVFFAPLSTPTNQQILLAWVQWWVDTTKQRIQQANTVTTVPPPIAIQ